MFDGPRSAAPLPDIASKRFGNTRVLDAARFARSARQRRLPDSCVSSRIQISPHFGEIPHRIIRVASATTRYRHHGDRV
ncbi:hypothetical protein BCEP4_860011 [Burkholderia cepacia]|uniref:hypothetical protein n=1 Tax=Burkholderia cepacia TaxID=292 RepID=UPI001CB3AB94|nr:hypothetical protein [Burkholderia cepacia]CAG9273773.1 hypothetical protein BCEP4_860011 [Burkholderia cepacia]